MQAQLENYLLTFCQQQDTEQLTRQYGDQNVGQKSSAFTNVRRQKNTKVCDYLIRGHQLQEKLKTGYTIQQVMSNLSEKFNTSIASCILNKYNNIEIKLNRCKAIHDQLRQILADEDLKLDQPVHQPNKKILINCCTWKWTETVSLNDLRGVLVASHLQKILKRIKYYPFIVNPVREFVNNNEWTEIIKEFHLEDIYTSELSECVKPSEEVLAQLKMKCLDSKYCVHQNGNYFIDASKFIRDCGLSKDGIFKNIELIKVFSKDITEPILLAVASLELAIHEEPNTSIIATVNVVPQNKIFYATRISLLWRILSNRSNSTAVEHQVNLVVDKVVNDTNSILALDLIRHRKMQMRQASIIKYGSVVDDPSWQDIIEEIASTAIKFEMLGTAANEPLKIVASSQHVAESLDKKGGSFVLYNCARLFTLFRHHNEQVMKSIYPSLPSFEKIDFTLLRNEEEWELFFNYIYNSEHFNDPFLSNYQGGDIEWRCNKMCQFMTALCRTFSSYYRSTRILTEPKSHLFPVMHARLYLLKALHLVLVNNLALLGVKPLSQL